MIETIPFEADNVVGFRITGKLRGETLDAISASLDDKLRRHAKVRIYAEMPRFEGMTPEAVFDDLRMALHHWRDIEREAVVTDEAWIRKITPLGAALAPGIEVRAFATADREAARAWIAS